MSAGPVSEEDAVDLDAAAGPRVGPSAVPGRSTATAPGQDATPLEDAGQDGHRGPAGLCERLTRWPGTAPEWVRGPGAVLAAAALAAALAGALSAHQADAQLRQAVAARTAALEVSVGATEVRGAPLRAATSVTGAGAREDAHLAVTLVNRGDDPVVVRLGALHLPDQFDTGPAEALEVAAGSTAVVTLPLEQDCASLPPGTEGDEPGWRLPTAGGQPGPTPPQEWLTATVDGPATGGAGAQRVRLPIARPASGAGVVEQLLLACRLLGPEAVRASPVEVRQDGRLVVRAVNDSSGAMLLAAQDAPGADLVSEPPLPVRLEPGASAELVLDLQVDCARVGTVMWQTYGSAVDLQVSADDGGRAAEDGPYTVLGDGGVAASWAARLVGAACGPSPASTER